MEATPYIPECEFTAYFEQVRLELARKIAHSGLSLSEIARATRMKWDTHGICRQPGQTDPDGECGKDSAPYGIEIPAKGVQL